MTVSSRRILVVEDSRTQAEALRVLLDVAGYRVDIRRSAEEALDFLHAAQDDELPYVILSDVMMPGLSGFEFCSAIKGDARLRHVHVILLTGLHDAADVIRGLACGADNYVTKPFDEQRLLARIEAIFAGSAVQEQAEWLDANFMGRSFRIAAEPQRILAFLLSSFEDTVQANAALRESEAERRRLFDREREARLEAEAANRTKADFLAAMSHDLRTPLNAIGGYAELLEMGVHGALPPAAIDYLQRIQRSQRHLLALVNDILNFARIERGGIPLDIVSIAADPILRELEELVAPQLGSRGLHYEYRPCPERVLLRCDVEKLRQVLLNLLSNAIKFTEAGGSIVLACEARGDVALISVQDTGRGIARDKLEVVFDPFVQGHRGAGREGVGLGLAISRALARAMGGDISVESTIGVGSTFTLAVPLARSGDVAGASIASAYDAGHA